MLLCSNELFVVLVALGGLCEIDADCLPVSATYIRLYARVNRLEDVISHFYNVINELRRRVSTLEKKLKPLAKDDLNGSNGGRKSPEAAAGRRDS